MPLCAGVPKRAGAVSDEDELEDAAAADAAAADSAADAAADPSQPSTNGGQSGPPPGTPSAAQRSLLGGTADSPQGGQPQRPSDGALRRWSWMDGDDGAREATQSGVQIAQEGQVFISCTDSQTSCTDCKRAIVAVVEPDGHSTARKPHRKTRHVVSESCRMHTQKCIG